MKNISKLHLLIFFQFLYCFFYGQTHAQDIWEKVDGPYGAFTTNIFKSSTGKIYAGGRGVLYSKINDQANWVTTLDLNLTNHIVSIVEDTSGKVFVSFTSGTYYTSDNGLNWHYLESQDSTFIVTRLAIDDSNNFYTIRNIQNSAKVLKSSDLGNTWREICSSSPALYGFNNIACGSNGLILVAGGFPQFLYRSTNYGLTWDSTYIDIQNFCIVSDSEIYATEYNEDIWKSTDIGLSWILIYEFTALNSITSLVYDNVENLYICFDGVGIYKLNLNSSTASNQTFNLNNKRIYDIELIDNKLWVATYGNGIYELNESDSIWVEKNYGMDYIIADNIVVDNLNSIWVGTRGSGIQYSYFNSNYWKEYSSNLITRSTNDITVTSNNEIYIVEGYSLFRLNLLDSTWIKLYTHWYGNLTDIEIKDSITIFISSNGFFEIMRSLNQGLNWTYLQVDDPYDFITVLKSLFNGDLLTGKNTKLFRSFDNGDSWTPILYHQGFNIKDITQTSNQSIIVGLHDIQNNSGKIYYSSDNGYTWLDMSNNFILPVINCLGTYKNQVLVGTNEGIFTSRNFGDNWQQINSGLTNLKIHSIAADKIGNIYAGTDRGLFKCFIDDISVIIDQSVIQDFTLEQNYPNPFNPSTTISYQLPKAGNVTLKVYDVLGREVATLVDEYKPAGSYEVEFNPASSIKNPASGIYFYQLKAGEFVETKKMLLIK